MNWDKLTRLEIRKLITERRLLLEDESDNEESSDSKEESTNYDLQANIKTLEQDTNFRQWVNSKANQDGEIGEKYKKAIELILKQAGLQDDKLDTTSRQLRNSYVAAIWSAPMSKNPDKTYGQAYVDEKNEIDNLNKTINSDQIKNFPEERYVELVKKYCDMSNEPGAIALTMGYLLKLCTDSKGYFDRRKYKKCTDSVYLILGGGKALGDEADGVKEKSEDPESVYKEYLEKIETNSNLTKKETEKNNPNLDPDSNLVDFDIGDNTNTV